MSIAVTHIPSLFVGQSPWRYSDAILGAGGSGGAVLTFSLDRLGVASRVAFNYEDGIFCSTFILFCWIAVNGRGIKSVRT
jgi:hypothetical protein